MTLWTIQSMEFSRPEYWSGQHFPSPGDLSNPGIEPRSPALRADSLPAEPRGKSKNTGVSSLSLLQGIFPTQESNWGVLHRRQILYQLSYQGSTVANGPGFKGLHSVSIYIEYLMKYEYFTIQGTCYPSWLLLTKTLLLQCFVILLNCYIVKTSYKNFTR